MKTVKPMGDNTKSRRCSSVETERTIRWRCGLCAAKGELIFHVQDDCTVVWKRVLRAHEAILPQCYAQDGKTISIEEERNAH